MSAQQVEEQGTDQVDVQDEARAMGWVPREEFKGDPNKWVDAEKFVEHGRTVLPILHKNNQTLIRNQLTMQQQIQRLTDELRARDNDFSTLQEFYNEQLVERVEQSRKQLRQEIKDAREDNDTDRELEAIDKLTQLNQSAKGLDDNEPTKGKKGKQEEGAEPPVQYTPAHLAWMDKHKAWWGVDEAKTQKAVGLGMIVRAERPDLVGEDFYKEVDRRMAGGQEENPRAQSKVAGSKGGGTGGGDKGRTYADLPAEAKAQCDKYAKKFVNPSGTFKTEADYRKHYIQTLEQTGYFEDR